MKKLAALTVESERFLKTEECDVETDKIKNISKCKVFPENKTITLIKKVKDCKPFIGVSILFLCFNNINRNNENNQKIIKMFCLTKNFFIFVCIV